MDFIIGLLIGSAIGMMFAQWYYNRNNDDEL